MTEMDKSQYSLIIIIIIIIIIMLPIYRMMAKEELLYSDTTCLLKLQMRISQEWRATGSPQSVLMSSSNS
jgi:uncharacterized membrane protein YqjE